MIYATQGATSCGDHRYLLTRRWKPGPLALWVMLNPSTADGFRDDPTVRKCVGFSDRWGYGALEVVNLFALRATDPSDLLQWLSGPLEGYRWAIGERNDATIFEAVPRADLVVLAWGGVGRMLTGRMHRVGQRSFEVLQSIEEHPGRTGPVACIGRTGSGAYKHPSRAAYTPAPEIELAAPRCE